MRFAALGFTLGVCLLQHQAELPGAGWLTLYCTFAAIAAIGFSRRVSTVIGACVMFTGFAALGFTWAAALAQLRLSDRLDPALEGRDVLVSGVVGGLPQALERGVRFDFDVESPEAGVPRRIVLSSYGGFAPDDSQDVLPVRAGERWRFTVRLRRKPSDEHLWAARDNDRGPHRDARVLVLASQRVSGARAASAEGRGARRVSCRVRLLPHFRIRGSRSAHAVHGRRGRRRALVRTSDQRFAGARGGALHRSRARSLGGPVAGLLALIRRGRGDFLRGHRSHH